LCQDSALAAPLVIDLVRLLDVAKQLGESGIQRQLSMFFKSPFHVAGETAVHDLFKQEQLLLDWARERSNRSSRRGAPLPRVGASALAAANTTTVPHRRSR
jgi:myo-inositol-1-phosphate synthase